MNQQNSLKRVVLTGFMGSGKTTVGRLLALRLGWDFLDLDDAVTQHCALSVPEIFSLQGEAAFRREETFALATSLARRHTVLALGGGVPESDENRALLRQAGHTAIVYLQGPFDILHARCLAQFVKEGTVVRPVLADIQAAQERFARRSSLYAEVATCTLDALDTPERVADQIVALLAS